MNARGQYGDNGGSGNVQVGAFLVHTLELKQRFNNAKAAAVQSLLSDLASNGVAKSVGTNRWEIALKDGVWVFFTWHPEYSGLEVTITDREVRAVDKMEPTRRRYEEMLRRITPQLQRFGATTVGAAVYAGQQAQQQPRFAARTRAIKAVFDMYTTSHRGAPYYIYAEVNGLIDKRSAATLDEANSIFFALEKSPGEVYVAIFDPTDPLWPGPAADVYHTLPVPPQAPPREGPAIVGSDVNAQARALIQSATREAVSSQARIHQLNPNVQPPAFYVWKLVAAPEEEGGPPSYANMNFLTSREEAFDYARRLNQSPAVVATAVFQPTSRHWPNPIAWSQSRSPNHQWAIDRYLTAGPMVGLTIYHSVGDRAEAVKAMAIDWNALYQNLGSQAGVLTADPKSSSGYRYLTQSEWDANPPDPKKVLWWKSYAEPLFKQWAKFKIDQLGGDRTVGDAYIVFAERFQTNWDVYEDWKKKLDVLRAEAEKRGFKVDTPKPADLPTTVWADVGDVVSRGAGKVASGLGDVWNIVKYGAWAVLGIGAVVTISSVASNLRSGKDPAEKYVEMIRTSRRPRAARALPAARAQLALPAGEGA